MKNMNFSLHEKGSNPLRQEFIFSNFNKKEAQWYEKSSNNSTAEDKDAA